MINDEERIKRLKEDIKVAQQRLAESRRLIGRLTKTMLRILGPKWMKKHTAKFFTDWENYSH